MRVAVVDLGTNTCRLLLAEVAGGAILRTAERITTVVRLGEGVDARRTLLPGAKERTLACLRGYDVRLESFDPERRLLVATSALRDAADGAEFLAGVEAALGLPCRVLTGEEEGGLTFRGATASMVAPCECVVVVDIGGGSTELCIGDPARPASEPTFLCSVDVGAVRLTERFFHRDPPNADEWRAAVDFTRRRLRLKVPLALRDAVRAGLGVAGTITTLVAFERGLREYRRELVDGRMLTPGSMSESITRFRRLTSRERGRLPGIQPGREDVILAGALIAFESCRLFGLGGFRCTEADIIEGAALALAEGSILAPAGVPTPTPHGVARCTPRGR